ncbi:HIT family protein [Streptomyces carminius]|uniref:HIT family protein n=1 Tax=Streptomyces carminius TaxID=2665496 RepID=UPI0018EBB709|nr:hypothetical protein [Streptomyces carminius]
MSTPSAPRPVPGDAPVADCAFCLIGRDEADTELVGYRSGNVRAVPNLMRRENNPGHTVVLPVAHVTALYEAPPALLAELFGAVAAWRPPCARRTGRWAARSRRTAPRPARSSTTCTYR